MLGEINKAFNSAKNNDKERRFMLESVLDDDELIGGDDDMEDVVDADSIPDDVYKRVDAALDKMIGDGIDDTEVEEMVDDDMSDINSEDIDLVITEAVGQADKKFWYDDENIGHPDQDRADGVKQQPLFDPSKKLNENTLAGKQYKSVMDEAVEKVAVAMGNAISEAVSAGIKTGMQSINEAEAKETKISDKEASPDGHETKEEPSGAKGDDKVEIGDQGEKATDVPEGEETLGHCAESKKDMKVLESEEMGPANDSTDKKVEASGKELPDPIDEKEKGSDADVKEATVDDSGKELENKECGPNTWTDDDKKAKPENQTPEVEVAPEGKDAASQLSEAAEPVMFTFGHSNVAFGDPIFESALDMMIAENEANIVDEGYNTEQHQKVSAALKKANAAAREARKAANAKDFDTAKAKIGDAIKNLEQFKSDFTDWSKEQDVSDAIIGNLLYELKNFLTIMIAAFTGLSLVYNITRIVVHFKELIDSVSALINIIKKDRNGEEISMADFNLCTREYTKTLDVTIANLKEIEKTISKKADKAAAKAEKKEKVDESAASQLSEAVEEMDEDESLPGIDDELYENVAVISNYRVTETIDAPETENQVSE